MSANGMVRRGSDHPIKWVRHSPGAETLLARGAGARLRAKKVNIRGLFSPPQGIDDTPIVGLDQRRASGGDEIMGYKPIESYGIIGDLHTIALVGIDGSIDWCCLPHFDSPSVFAAILDDQKGGSFRIASLYEAQHKQMYMPDSNVLVTRFLSDQGVGEVVDFMPVQGPREIGKIHQIVRVVRAVRGSVRFRLDCRPAFDFARRPHQVVLEGRGAIFEAQGMKVSLISRFPLARLR